jgi:LuxR family transcriptional activator of conjugal transfer of Ti plasmids
MTATHVVQEFMDAVHTASDEVAFAGAASRLGEALGFRWFTYLSVDAGRPDVISTYPAIWSEHYLSSGYDQVDPVVAASRRQTIPFFWGALDGARPSDAAAIRLFDDAASFGIVSGLTVPLRGPKGRMALFTLSTDEVSPALLRRAEELKTYVQVCGLHLHNELAARVARFMPEHQKPALTPRQRACLLAAAEGQSAKQAARSIDLTPRTVQHHHEEARRRLGARSLTHAVALALRDGMIS